MTHEDVSKQDLGGAMTHNATSGVAHFVAARRRRMPGHDSRVARVSSAQQSRGRSAARATSDPVDRADAALDSMVPADPMQPYDIKDVIHAVVDDNYFFEVHEHFAKNIVVGFARLGGQPVGVVANQPAVLAGVLDINASVKGRALRALLRCVSIFRW